MVRALTSDACMICPYCQHDLEVDGLACPRCGAEFERRVAPFGIGLRLAAISGVLLLVFSVMLVDCVLNWLPGGPDSRFATLQQLQAAEPPDFRSAAVNGTLTRWSEHEQAMTGLPQFVGRAR
jgi:hypothetical protein